jgi:hypothetical protein
MIETGIKCRYDESIKRLFVRSFLRVRRKVMKRVLIVLILVICALVFTSPVKADIAPPEQPSGPNIEPGTGFTMVRMSSELVVIKVSAETPKGSLGHAAVTASFNMHNLGTEDEKLQVRFPVAADDGWGNLREIKNVAVKVEGSTLPTRRITGVSQTYGGEEIPWVQFPVAFPAGKDVHVQVSYTLEASGMDPFIWFTYTLSTGAGWQGTIGSANIIVELPYTATPQNVMMGSANSEFTNTVQNGVLHGRNVIWNFVNFEPEEWADFKVELVAPSAWQEVLKYQAITASSPNDGENWGLLARAYKQLVFSPRRGFGLHGDTLPEFPTRELYRLSRQAYTKALALKPEDPLWHAGYADLLAQYAYWGHWSMNTIPEAQEAMRQIKTALALAPDNLQVQEIAQSVYFNLEDGMVQTGENTYDYPWLTASPTPTITPTPTPTISPTLLAKHTP